MSPELPGSPAPAAKPARPVFDDGSLGSPLGRSATFMLFYLVLLWIAELVNAAQERQLSIDYGVIGRDPDRLVGIVISPFLHANAEHLVANATAVFTLGLVAGLYGVWRLVGILAVIIVLGGLVEWVISPSDAITVGASGVVFGLFGYLATRGIFDRRPVDIVISLGVAVAFGYSIATGIVPQDGRISWEGHLAGFVAGVLAAWLFRRRKPKATVEQASSPMDTNPTDALQLPDAKP